jgi:hypothetical protein
LSRREEDKVKFALSCLTIAVAYRRPAIKKFVNAHKYAYGPSVRSFPHAIQTRHTTWTIADR